MPLNVVRREGEHLYAAEPVNQSARGPVEGILRLLRAERDCVEQIRTATGLSDNEFHAIRYLLQAQRDGRDMGPKDLIVMLGLSSASVTKLVDRLEELGQLEREPHRTDRRAWVLIPTPEAAHKIESSYRPFHEAVVDAMDALSPAEAQVVDRALNEVIARLESAELKLTAPAN